MDAMRIHPLRRHSIAVVTGLSRTLALCLYIISTLMRCRKHLHLFITLFRPLPSFHQSAVFLYYYCCSRGSVCMPIFFSLFFVFLILFLAPALPQVGKLPGRHAPKPIKPLPPDEISISTSLFMQRDASDLGDSFDTVNIYIYIYKT